MSDRSIAERRLAAHRALRAREAEFLNERAQAAAAQNEWLVAHPGASSLDFALAKIESDTAAILEREGVATAAELREKQRLAAERNRANRPRPDPAILAAFDQAIAMHREHDEMVRREDAAELARLEAMFGNPGPEEIERQRLRHIEGERQEQREAEARILRFRKAWTAALTEVGADRAVVIALEDEPRYIWTPVKRAHADATAWEDLATRDITTARIWQSEGHWPEVIPLEVAREMGLARTEHEEAVEEGLKRKRLNQEILRRFAAENGGFGILAAEDLESIDDMLDEAPPVSWINGVFGAGEIVILLGVSHAGKSFVSLGAAASISTGLPWAGRAARRARVLYLAFEGQATLRDRADALRAHLEVELLGVTVVRKSASFLDSGTVEWICEQIRAGGFEVVILDTISRSIAGADENSAEIMSGLVRELNRVREAMGHDGTVIALHHPTKADSSVMRGSGALFAAADRVVSLEMESVEKPERILRTLKDRSGRIAPDFHLEFSQVPGTRSAVLVEGTEGGKSLVMALRNLLNQRDEVTRFELTDLAVRTGLYASAASVRTVLARHIKRGEIVESDGLLTLPERA